MLVRGKGEGRRVRTGKVRQVTRQVQDHDRARG